MCRETLHRYPSRIMIKRGCYVIVTKLLRNGPRCVSLLSSFYLVARSSSIHLFSSDCLCAMPLEKCGVAYLWAIKHPSTALAYNAYNGWMGVSATHQRNRALRLL